MPIARSSSASWPRERRPTRDDLLAAHGKSVPDVIAPGLRVLFCGINPGLYTAAVGHHFARPGNRFWPALHRSGFTDRQLSPFDERELLERRIGVTNLFNFATANADELAAADLRDPRTRRVPPGVRSDARPGGPAGAADR